MLHEWSLSPDDDRDDLELVKTANPAPWITVYALRERHDSPSMTPWAWARFACGVWMFGQDGAISAKEWAACAEQGIEIPGGSAGVHVGIDLAGATTPPPWCPFAAMASSSTVHPPRILNPPADWTSLSVEEIFDVVEEWAERWPALTFVLDPNAGGEQLAQRIDAEVPNVTVATHSQRPTTMAMAAQRLSEAIATGKIRHPDDEALNAHVLAASARPVGEGWRLVKARKSAAPIDAAIALAMAVSTVIGGEAEPEFATAQWPGGI